MIHYLKKVLALVLVVATLMGFATVASAQYTDDSSIDYKEAVEVMSAINVINGYTDGSFRPDGNVTRAQMAKMVAYIIAGGEDVGGLYASANTFTDCTTHWAKGYIAYASMTGFVAGVGNNKFNPEGSVTGTQAAKMLLCALGYDATIEGYTGPSWAVNTLADAKEAGLLDGLTSIDMGAALSRENAAKMMLNALQADMVEYETKGSTITINGIEFAQGASAAKVVTSTEDWAENINDDDAAGTKDDPYTVQLGEKYFPDLVYTSKTTTADDFGRPAHKWEFDGEDVGTYADTAKFVYTAAIDKDDLKDELEKYTVAASATYVENGGKGQALPDPVKKEDGSLDDSSAKDAIAGLTGNGTVVELFVSNKEITKVVVIKSTFGEVTVKEFAETKTRGAYTQYTVGGNTYRLFSTVVDEDKDLTKAVVNGDVADGDMVLYYVVNGTAYISAVDTVSGTLTGISNDGVYTIDGQKYSAAAAGTAAGTLPTKAEKDAAEYYVDSYGYLLGAVEASSDTTYAMVLESDTEWYLTDNNKMESRDYALVAYVDGTVEKLTTTENYGDNTGDKFVGKVVKLGDVTDGKTELETAGTAAKAVTSITKGSAALGGTTLLANNNTSFVFADYKDDELAGTVTTYTGRNNVFTVAEIEANGAYAIDTDDDGVANVVFVSAQVSETASDEYVYVKGTYTTTTDGTVYDVIIKGEDTTLTMKNDSLSAGLYSKVQDKKGASTLAKDTETALNKLEYVAGVLKTDGKNYTIEDDVAVYIIDEADNTCVTLQASNLNGEIDGVGYAVIDDGTEITTLYVVYNSNDAE